MASHVFSVLLLISYCSSGLAQIFRSSCRRDALMKLTDRDTKMTGTVEDLISDMRVAGVRLCIKRCVRENECASVNFKVAVTLLEKNCELLKISKSTNVDGLTSSSGWMHYEPVSQVGPRCRTVACNPGFECIEQCGTWNGYDCVDIDECASNPCQNGGTCSNQASKYTCTCPQGVLGTNCEQDTRAKGNCVNNGDVVDISDDPMIKFKCICPFGYGGEHCEITTNLALQRSASQISTYQNYSASLAVDGNQNSNLASGFCSHTLEHSSPWWSVDLGSSFTIGTVRITNRNCFNERLSNFDVKVGMSLGTSAICYSYSGTVGSSQTVALTCNSELAGRFVYVVLRGTNSLALCEVQVFSSSTKYTSCKELKSALGTSKNALYNLWDSAKASKYTAYCHMSDGGWTLVARFSNADTKNWAEPSGSYWYDKTAVGSTTSPSANSDMISKAFYNAKGTDIKLTRSDSTSHSYLLYSSGCMSTTTFRSKITSYGNFRNNGLWSRDRCLGTCYVNSYQYVYGVSGFSQYNCNSNIQSANYIGFWCHYGTGDGAVIMIGGGGSSCARADHGIAITEENDPRIGTLGTMDFGDNTAGTTSYALNLWVR